MSVYGDLACFICAADDLVDIGCWLGDKNAQQVGADVVILQTSWDETELHDSNKYPLSRQIYYGWPFSKCFFSYVDLRTHDCFIGVAP